MTKSEAVERRVDEREDLEEGVVDGVNQTGVEICKGDGRVRYRDLNRLDESVDDDGVGGQVALGNLTIGFEARRAGDRAEASGTAMKDRRSRSFGHEKQHENADWASKLGAVSYLKSR